jgi:TPR repeat protein
MVENFESLKALAEKGNAEAQFSLGQMYWIGEGVESDNEKAEKLIRKAAEQGLAIAQTNLGLMYSMGSGLPQEDKEVVKWYRKAAEQGEAIAQMNLGMKYEKGEGVLEDVTTAYAWINIAAANGLEVDAWSAEHYKGCIAKGMTPEQITEAQELSKEMIAKNPKLINK